VQVVVKRRRKFPFCSFTTVAALTGSRRRTIERKRGTEKATMMIKDV
jgi:hypothetical protein